MSGCAQCAIARQHLGWPNIIGPCKGRAVRRPITLFAASGLLPLVGLGAVFGAVTLGNQREAVEDRARAHARFAATLIADRLSTGTTEVAIVAQSPTLDDGVDKDRFRILATRVLAQQPVWRSLSVANSLGSRLIDIPAAIAGRPHGPVLDFPSFRRAVQRRRSQIGAVMRGPRRTLAFAIRVPIIRDERLTGIVSAIVPSNSLRTFLRFEPLPPGWRAVVIDGSGIVIAKTDPQGPVVGQKGTASALQARLTGRPTPYSFIRTSGEKAVGVYAPVAGTPWTVHVSAPASLYSGPLRRALALAVGATAICLVLFLLIGRLLLQELRQNRRKEAAAVQVHRMEALGRLTGGVAHDLNNLLTPILGGLDLLRRRVSEDARSLRHVELASASAERARLLVARLLSFSRRQTLAAEDVELGALLTGLSDLLERSLTPAIELRLQPGEKSVFAHVDVAQLELAILNLAINARDAMAEGGEITIEAREAVRSEIQTLPPGPYVTVAVQDTGSGMDEETLRHATDPFFTTKTSDRGTGLGLSMVEGFAAQSGGALLLKSTKGRGTYASIVLPAGSARTNRAIANPVQGIEQSSGHVLLVDDDDAVRDSTAAMLQEVGFEVTVAHDVNAALALIDNGAFDVVITDFLMPGRSGAELIQELEVKRPDLPILVITGYMGAEDRLPEMIVRLRKPFKVDELQDCMRKAISRHRLKP